MTVDQGNPSANRRQVEITATGLAVPDPMSPGGKRQFAYDEIDYVLLSSENVLSFQIGHEVFSIRIKPENPKHMQALEKLLNTLRSLTGQDAGSGGQ